LKSNVDGANLGESLKGKTGRRYWKSLEQLAGTPEFQKWVDDEFPHRSTLMKLDRRELLKFMGAGMMLAGLAANGCRKLPEHRVVPFIAGPEDYVPGKPVYYASIATMGGYATGVRVKTHEGRPIKLDGNPNHPASLGSLDARTQAQVLDLYDPDRLRMPTYKGDPATWSEFSAKAGAKLTELAPNGGSGVVLVTQMVGSPTLYSQIQNFLIRHPAAQWVQYEAASRRNMIEGAAMALSPVTESHFRFDLRDHPGNATPFQMNPQARLATRGLGGSVRSRGTCARPSGSRRSPRRSATARAARAAAQNRRTPRRSQHGRQFGCLPATPPPPRQRSDEADRDQGCAEHASPRLEWQRADLRLSPWVGGEAL
jgi:MoCo/4Fe-4S cofactor protein with predicted Tat translocation signal